MGLMIPIALFGFIPLALLAFAMWPARRAVMICYLAGWLFLPQASFKYAGAPDYDKYAAIALGTMLGVLIFDSRVLTQYRPRLLDLLMVVFCVWPLFSYLYHGAGLPTGLNWVLVQLFIWGVPYSLGRLYFNSREAVRELAVAIFIGGLVYAPLCWFEIRMSPKLSPMVYGFFRGSYVQAIRYGGWRPIVFMQHGLMVALWMAATSIVGYWLWRSRSLVKIGRLPMWLLVAFMFITTVACKSGNGVVALGIGLLASEATLRLRRPAILALLAMVPPAYVTLRTADLWSGDDLVALIARVDKVRAGSLGIRMHEEDLFTDRAMQQPLFGWTGKEMMPRNEGGKALLRGNDAFWIITFGMYGLVSLIAIFALLTAVPVSWALRQPRGIRLSQLGPEAGLALAIILFAIDCLVNGMLNPVFMLATGAMAGDWRYSSSRDRVLK